MSFLLGTVPHGAVELRQRPSRQDRTCSVCLAVSSVGPAFAPFIMYAEERAEQGGAHDGSAQCPDCWGGVLKGDGGRMCDKAFVKGRRHMCAPVLGLQGAACNVLRARAAHVKRPSRPDPRAQEEQVLRAVPRAHRDGLVTARRSGARSSGHARRHHRELVRGRRVVGGADDAWRRALPCRQQHRGAPPLRPRLPRPPPNVCSAFSLGRDVTCIP